MRTIEKVVRGRENNRKVVNPVNKVARTVNKQVAVCKHAEGEGVCVFVTMVRVNKRE